VEPTEQTSPSEGEFLVRPGTPGDLPAVYDVYAAAIADGVVPEPRPEAEVRAWIDGAMDDGKSLWVAERDEELLGFAVVRGAWLFLLFVHPGRRARGVGVALMELVKALQPHGFGLRVHVANERARSFYRRHGFIELESTDGSSFPDQAADVKMAWLGDDPLTYLRGRIDEVDDELAVLLARRAALTGAVQDHKEVGGHAGRDPDREAEIVDRMAAHVPGLDRDQLARVMHTVIAESLAAWERRDSGS
jgi:chorismate mutase/ribosomal protein S18 acetylase RimI-like enzyme